MENEKKRLHEWFGLGCYHRWKREVDGPCPEADNKCVDCGHPHTDYDYGWPHSQAHTRPDYSTESGFFALLSGLRAKGYYVNVNTSSRYDGYQVILDRGRSTDANVLENADTLPEALFNAAIKAMDAENESASLTDEEKWQRDTGGI